MDVEESWVRIEAWLREYAPLTYGALRPPASAENLDRVEAGLSQQFPDDYRRSMLIHDGVQKYAPGGDQYLGTLTPDSELLASESIGDVQGFLTEVGAKYCAQDPEGYLKSAAEPAGTTPLVWFYLPTLIPIADRVDGDFFYIDTRPGALHGCIGMWFREGDHEPVVWKSFGGMLQAIADSLETGSDVLFWRHRVDDGALDWDNVYSVDKEN